MPASGMSNEELIALQKAAITAANTLAVNGKLNPAQADRFIDFVFDETKLKDMTRMIRFRNETLDIDKIGVGQRVAVRKSEAVDPGIRRGVSTSKISLTPVEIMVPLEISDVFREINIAGDSVVEHILRIFARQLANDLEELYIHGNAVGYLVPEGDIIDGGHPTDVIVDSYLNLFDGFLKLADSANLVDAGGDPISTGFWRLMLSAMPSKFKRDRSRLRWLVPLEIDELWRERVASRATGMGDMALNGDQNQKPFGIEMVPLPLMDFFPQQVEAIAFTGANSTIQLSFAPIQQGSVTIIGDADADGNPTPPFITPTDYTVDHTLGRITHDSGGAIGNNELVRISYRANPQILLVALDNLIIGIGRDITMEKDRDIFRSVDQFATTVKVAVQIEELTAVVKGFNLSATL